MNSIEEKWEPILEMLKIEDPIVKKFLAEYAEHHANKELEYNNIIDHTGVSLLPVSLKILSKLNLKNKNLVISEELETTTFGINIDILDELPFGIRYDEIIYQVSEQIVDFFNTKLETETTFYANLIISSIKKITDGSRHSKYIITTRCEVK